MGEAEVRNAHDRIFQTSMSDIRVARDFFENHLPAEIKQYVNLETLAILPTTYIDPKLAELRSDILYSVEIANTLGYIHLACEHQSSVDTLMPLRDLEYRLGIWRNHIKKTQTEKLPLILTFVFYNGESKYYGPRDLRAMMIGPEYLIDLMHNQPLRIIDVNDISDGALREQTWFGILGYFMKHVRQRDLHLILNRAWDWMNEVYSKNASDYIKSLLNYALEKGDIDQIHHFIIDFEKKSLECNGGIMSAAEKIREYGKNEGRTEGLYHVLVKMLKLKFGSIPASYLNILGTANYKTMAHWCEKVIVADTLEDVFLELEAVEA